MHQTVKTIFRLFFAVVIFLITLALFFSAYSKSKEILQADQQFQQAKHISLKSTDQEQLVLVSNNKRPDQAIFILIAQNGYIAKLNCEHYLQDICTDEYNQLHTRQIQQLDLLKVGQQHYIENIRYQDSRTQKQQQWSYSTQQIQQFYQADIARLKYIVFSIVLFALAALYVSIRIIRNFKKFLTR
ncbi:hypothetical protein [Acinetobacter terrae]|jgi:lipopolysaccharide export LptBFGC system permease protein LptF|uniref:hypothetical protein n=1 Tax=Acinetobacter terrae TaxID=2731247 RepID=UPI0007D7CC52|nr:hypothetical protein [Acinetobacter terrae]NNH15713.1 hypothetical protein [Acinetobacter terrae]OAL85897.1 hypothetical protein AY608_13990 [Acinetobacter terrae]